METVLRPDILQAYSGPCEQSNDMFYSENGEVLYNNQIFSRWGGESLVGPPEPYSMHDPEYDGLFYTDIQNYNGNIRNVDNLNLLNEEGCCTENRPINDAVKVGSEITDFSKNTYEEFMYMVDFIHQTEDVTFSTCKQFLEKNEVKHSLIDVIENPIDIPVYILPPKYGKLRTKTDVSNFIDLSDGRLIDNEGNEYFNDDSDSYICSCRLPCLREYTLICRYCRIRAERIRRDFSYTYDSSIYRTGYSISYYGSSTWNRRRHRFRNSGRNEFWLGIIRSNNSNRNDSPAVRYKSRSI